jgi:hypothetical protein
MFVTQQSDLLVHTFYVGGSQIKLHHHITTTEMETIFEVLLSDLTQRIGTKDL